MGRVALGVCMHVCVCVCVCVCTHTGARSTCRFNCTKIAADVDEDAWLYGEEGMFSASQARQRIGAQ